MTTPHKWLHALICAMLLAACNHNGTIRELAPPPTALSSAITTKETKLNDVEIKNSNGTTSLHTQLGDKPTLVIYLADLGCHSCSEREIEMLKHFLGESNPNVIIVGRFNNTRECTIFAQRTGLNTFRLSGKQDIIDGLSHRENAMFVADSYGNARHLLKLKGNDHLTKDYYNWFRTQSQ